MFDGIIKISIKFRIRIHLLDVKKKVLGCYTATLGEPKEIRFPCTNVDFGHVEILQNSKTDEKTHVLVQKTHKPLTSVKVYHSFVTNCH